MKRTAGSIFIVILLAGAAIAQTTAFRYQGSLASAGNPATGNFDFDFLLFDALSGGSQIGVTLSKSSVPLANGLFSVELDFGDQFPGANRFLEIRVRPSGGGLFTLLAPRQSITSAPYAVKSVNAETASSATNSLQLGGVSANQYVVTNDPRMSDARNPLPGSSNYVQNTNSPQPGVDFNINGTGTASIVNATTQFNLGGLRAFTITGATGNLNSNTFAGIGAGQSNTPSPFTNAGNWNSFFGRNAGTASTTGAGNSFFGYLSGVANTGGGANSFFGTSSGNANTNGAVNAFFGNFAGFSNTTESGNTFIGASADGAAGVMSSTALGYRSKVTQSDSLVLGAINGINNATVSTKVGIGTTAPVAPLEVVGNWNNIDGAMRLSGDRPTLRMTGGPVAGNQSWIMHLGSNGPGNLEFYRTCGVACWLPSLSMGTTGKVGVNVVPSFGLHVVSADNTGLRVQTNSTGGTIASFGGNGDFQVDAVNVAGGRFIVKENGNVGIGTTNPIVKLEVNGGFIVNGGVQIASGIGVAGHAHVGSLQIDTLFAGGSTLCRNVTGSVSNCSSSIRYKTDVEPFSSGLKTINRLRPVSYTWKVDQYRDLGLIAEEVEEVEPLLTFQNKQGQVEGVRYEKLGVLFINAFKEQQAQIEEQKDLIEKQQRQIDALKGVVCQQSPSAKICLIDQ